MRRRASRQTGVYALALRVAGAAVLALGDKSGATVMLRRREIRVPCTVTVINTFDSLEAHVDLADGIFAEPGDEVEVDGDPIQVPFGETARIERMATVRRAGPIERVWTRMTGDLEFLELCEFSFSAEKSA